jgi:N-acetylmuramoyl-L-alanine amidase
MEVALRRGALVLVVLLSGCTATAAPVQQQQAAAVLSEAQAAPTAEQDLVLDPTAEPTATSVAIEPTAAPTVQAAVQPAAAATPQTEATTTPQSAAAAAPPAAPAAAPQATAATPQAAPVAAPAPLPDACTQPPSAPLPAPGSAGAQSFFRGFRDPFPPAALYNPPGPKRVGLQVGHWKNEEAPPELGRLQAGATGGGKQEWEVNLDVAQRTAALLEDSGIDVDVLPATVPPRYQANVFVALHADGDPAGAARGFKIARPGFSAIPDIDDRLVDVMNDAYAAATGLPRDDEHISLRMRYYYAFNARRYCHAVDTGVPQAIVEMGYLTSATDRQWLIGDPDRLARGLADGITDFLATLP